MSVQTTCLAQEGIHLTAVGEKLIAEFPAPKTREADLTEPCVDGTDTVTETDELFDTLTSRRVYLFAFISWGVKWFPKHVANPRYRWMGLCTDELFLLRQFKKAIGSPVTDIWTKSDVSKLILFVESRALELSASGQLGAWILEPGVYP